MMNLQNALNASANIPAFWTYKLLQEKGVDVKSYMDKMNYHIDLYNIESLPLGGGVETTVVDNTNAYQALANGGAYNRHHIVEKITAHDGTVVYQHEVKPVQVYSKEAASIMTHLLRGVLASGETSTFKGRLAGLNPTAASKDLIGKTGTSNDTADVWLMLSTPRITVGTWAGHDDNSGMDFLTGYNNNAAYVSYLISTIHDANPSLFDGQFALADGVIASSVLASTGQGAGTSQYNGRTYSVSGAMTTSYWAKNGAPVTTYNFMVGGTSSDKAKAWNTLFGQKSSSSSSSKPSSSSSDSEEESNTEPGASGN